MAKSYPIAVDHYRSSYSSMDLRRSIDGQAANREVHFFGYLVIPFAYQWVLFSMVWWGIGLAA